MLTKVLAWGLKPSYVTGDSWYTSTDNLKRIRKEGLGFMVAVKANCTVSIDKGKWEQVQTLSDSDFVHNSVWLKDFGFVRLLRTHLKDQERHYVLFDPKELDKLDTTSLIVHFGFVHSLYWRIEQFQRALKQVCSIEKFQVRRKRMVLNLVFASIIGFVYLSTMVKSMYY